MIGSGFFVVWQLASPGKQTTKEVEQKSGPTTLQFWGVYDNPTVFQPIIDAYEKTHSGTRVIYTQKESSLYEFASLNLLATQDGPDVWLIPQDWLPKHADKLTSIPEGWLAQQNAPKPPAKKLFQKATPAPSNIELFNQLYTPVTGNENIHGNSVLTVPLAVDTLGLFVNVPALQRAGITALPATWEQVIEATKKLSKSKGVELEIPAIGLGTSNNIARASDIVAALMIQNHTLMVNDKKNEATYNQSISKATGEFFEPGVEALDFYTSFASPTKENYSWSAKQPNAYDLFSEGKLPMMIDYSYRLRDLEQANPNLPIAAVEFPQIAGTNQSTTLAATTVVGVPKVSKQQAAAWDFIQFLTNRSNSLSYAYAAGRPPARKDLLNETGFNPQLTPFLRQIDGKKPAAHFWYRNEINKTDTVFRQAVDIVLSGQPVATVIDKLTKQVTHILRNESYE